MFSDVTISSMTLPLVVAVAVLSATSGLSGAQNFNSCGATCGDKRCAVTEYCSVYDTQCRSCADVCDTASHNYQAEECTKDCQVYLQCNILRSDLRQYDDLRGDVERLRTMFIITTTLTCLSLLGILYLLGRTLIRWEKIQNTLRAVFTNKWAKQTSNKNKVQDDAENGGIKQNGLKLTMPTISATVESSQSTGNSNDTPNTTTTSLSRRHPSEDATLDYAYDNPAMTPSPEAAQLRTKRESSF